VDHPPTLGGSLTCEEQFCGLTEANSQEFWTDLEGVAIQAYRNLDVDGLIHLMLPSRPEKYRIADHSTLERRERGFPTAESVRDYIKALPDPGSLVVKQRVFCLNQPGLQGPAVRPICPT